MVRRIAIEDLGADASPSRCSQQIVDPAIRNTDREREAWHLPAALIQVGETAIRQKKTVPPASGDELNRPDQVSYRRS